MKKALFLLILFIQALSSFAQIISDDYPNRNIFLDGTAERQDHLDFFMEAFRDEAIGTGFPLTDNINEAGFIFKFDISLNTHTDEFGNEFLADPDDYQYIIRINFRQSNSEYDLISYSFFFDELEDMYEHTQLLFFNAARYVPQLREEDMLYMRVIVQPYAEPENQLPNKWFFLRASFDYPITFYSLKPNGLIGGIGLYSSGDPDNPGMVSPLDHKVIVLPGVTLGVEFVPHKNINLEFNFQVFMGEPSDNMFFNMAIGAELRFPLVNTNSFILAPYGAVSFPVRSSEEFQSFPLFAAGGGIQLALKGNRYGYFFIDSKFLFSFDDAVMKNPYLSFDAANQLYPYPDVIHYRRYFFGLSVGYKFGLLDIRN